MTELNSLLKHQCVCTQVKMEQTKQKNSVTAITAAQRTLWLTAQGTSLAPVNSTPNPPSVLPLGMRLSKQMRRAEKLNSEGCADCTRSHHTWESMHSLQGASETYCHEAKVGVSTGTPVPPGHSLVTVMEVLKPLVEAATGDLQFSLAGVLGKLHFCFNANQPLPELLGLFLQIGQVCRVLQARRWGNWWLSWLFWSGLEELPFALAILRYTRIRDLGNVCDSTAQPSQIPWDGSRVADPPHACQNWVLDSLLLMLLTYHVAPYLWGQNYRSLDLVWFYGEGMGRGKKATKK